MWNLTRRHAIKGLVTGSAGLALIGVKSATSSGMTPDSTEPLQGASAQLAKAFRGEHQPKPLAFDPSKLKGLSEKLLRSHHENNYTGAVKALNAVEQRLDAMMKDKDLPAYVYGDLKREELVRTGSVVLHEYYFTNLGGDGKAGGKIQDLIKQWFGSYEQW